MSRGPVEPVTPQALVDRLGALIAARPGIVRVAIDAPSVAAPDQLALHLVEPLRLAGRRAVHVAAQGFWRDASLRLEHGHKDSDAFLDWLDAPALRREVLEPAITSGTYLPSLRDPRTNRATRAGPEPLDENTVVLVSGAFLLGLGLPFDLVIHLAVSAAARARRTPADERWTLPAYDRYDREVDPAALADVVVRWDDPQRPAVSGLT